MKNSCNFRTVFVFELYQLLTGKPARNEGFEWSYKNIALIHNNKLEGELCFPLEQKSVILCTLACIYIFCSSLDWFGL